MKDFFKNLYYRLLMMLPTKAIAYIENFRAYKKVLNLKSPKYFGEKIQWLKLYGNLEKYNMYVDKYEVRNYIKEKVGEKYLIKLIASYDNVNEIRLEDLPNQFVLKCNHGSGYNVICKNKENFNFEETKKKLNKWMKEDFYKIKGEIQYKNVKKKIVCEEYIEDSNGELKDFRFFCFNGNPELVLVDNELHGKNPKRDFYDMNWNKLKLRNHEPNSDKKMEKPINFEEMIEVSKKLSQDIPFVRVDLYNVDGKIYFGELTLTHTGGRKAFSPLEKDIEIASKINLEEYK